MLRARAQPRTQGTITFSINLFGVITGYYVDASNVAHGFVTAAPFRTFITLNDPDAGQGAGQGTFAGNVNLGGEISGNYIDANGVSHGFVTYSALPHLHLIRSRGLRKHAYRSGERPQPGGDGHGNLL